MGVVLIGLKSHLEESQNPKQSQSLMLGDLAYFCGLLLIELWVLYSW